MPILSVAVHLQDTYLLCGPACAQMVVRTLAPPLLAQTAFHTAVTAPTSWGFVTTPDQLADMLNQKIPSGAAYAVRSGTFAAAMAAVTASLDAGHPAIALTSQGFHWMVVRGLSGTGGRLVHVRDPSPDRTLIPGMPQPPPGHTDSDDCDEASQLAHSVSDEVVSWSAWQNDYFSACTGTNPWKGKHVVLTPVAGGAVAPAPSQPTPVHSGSHAISAPDAILTAYKQIEHSGLLAVPAWSAAYQSASKALLRAVLVERLDGAGAYYLAALAGGGGLSVVVHLDAVTGELLGARLNAAMVVRLISAPPPPGHQRYVWTPAPATFYSPYFPMSEAATRGGASTFVRMLDRQQFRELTQSTI
ncbi:MAG: C39 family peptidase [Vicinamibacterales bacterium]